MTRPDNFCALSLRLRGLGLLLASLLVPGCQVAYGTYNAGVDGASGDASVSSGGTTANTAPALGGAAQGGAPGTGGATATDWGDCDGTQLYACRDVNILKCVNDKWALNDTCTKVSFCNTNTGLCDKCALNDRRCGPTTNGGSAVFVCTDPQAGFTQSTICEPPGYCADDVQRCVVCEVNETHCVLDDAGLPSSARECSASRSEWNDLTYCVGGCQTVDGKKDICPNCIEGNTACQPVASSDKWLVRTCTGGAWITTDTCTAGCIQPTSVAPAACL